MGGIGDEAAPLAIGKEVEFVEHRLPDQHFVTENQRFFDRIATEEFENDRLGDADSVFAAVRVFSDALTALLHAELLKNMHRDDGSDSPGIDQGLGLVRPYHLRFEPTAPQESFVHRIGKSNFDSYFAHLEFPELDPTI